MSTLTPEYVSTNRVARALGVSVSTVKRWVDDGVLPAHKTAGGHRKLLAADVLDLARREDLPHVNLLELASEGRDARSPAQLANDLHDALVRGDGDQVRTLLHGNYRRGMAIEALADHVIGPAMKRIGEDWASGKIDVMEEHRASQVCAAVLYELKAILENRAGKYAARAVGGSPEGDHSLLPTLLAQMALLDAGWEAVQLGPNTPLASFEKAVVEIRPRLLWICFCHASPDEAFLAGYRNLYQRAERLGVAVAVGGRALTEPIRSRMPYTTYGDGLSHLAAFARTLCPRPARPRRGRPRKEP